MKYIPENERTINQKEAVEIIKEFEQSDIFNQTCKQFEILANKRNELEHSHLSHHPNTIKHPMIEGFEQIFNLIEIMNPDIHIETIRSLVSKEIKQYEIEKEKIKEFWFADEWHLSHYFRCPKCNTHLVHPNKKSRLRIANFICKDCMNTFTINSQIEKVKKSHYFSETHKEMLFFYNLTKEVFNKFNEDQILELGRAIIENDQINRIIHDPDVYSVCLKIGKRLRDSELKNKLNKFLDNS